MFQLCQLSGEDHEVVRFVPSPDHSHIAVGYINGTIGLYEVSSGKCDVVFRGHKSAITCLNYDEKGMRLVSGSKVSWVILD